MAFRRNCKPMQHIQNFLHARLTSASELTFIINPHIRGTEDERCKTQNDDKKDPRQSGGIPHIEIAECILIEINVIEKCGMLWASQPCNGTARGNIYLREILKGGDHAEYKIIEEHGRHHRKRDIPKALPGVCAIHFGGIV